jgi:hypothetical protein
MNGRVYDPLLAMFLSPDNYIQAPDFTQNFNRYSYALGNPLKYIDPSGNYVAPSSDVETFPHYYYSDSGFGVSGSSYFSRPGNGLNGSGLNGTYYDWSTGTYRNTGDYSAVQVNPEIIMQQAGAVTFVGETAQSLLGKFFGGFSLYELSAYGRKTYIASKGDPLVYGSDNTGYRALNQTAATFPGVLLAGIGNAGPHPQGGSDYAWPGVLAFAGTAAVADGPIPIGDVIGGAVVLGYGTYVLADKMASEITRIYEKVNNTRGFTYELRATTSGLYPNVRGGLVSLNAGDVWKYGETTQGFDRYSQNFLTTNRLQMVPIFYGNVAEIKVQEKIMIYGYYFQNGTLPPGNRIFR